jgi:hypothetical protein
VNVAARLERAAAPGDVLIGVPTYQLVRDAVIAEAIDPLTLKGKSSALAAYRLVEVRPGAAGHSRRLDSPIVGRVSELTVLLGELDRARTDGRCRLVTALGQAGIGKSRLLTEFESRVVEKKQARFVWGRCLSYGEGITYWPVRQVVYEMAGITDPTPSDEARRKSSVSRAKGLTPLRSPTVWPPSSGLVKDTFHNGRGSGPSGDSWRRWQSDTPLVVAIEDIHWAEPTFLDLIEYVAGAASGSLLLVCSARPELLQLRSEWGAGLATSTIQLEPLPDSEAELLVANLLGQANLQAIRDAIVDAAGGNPLFAEELFSMFIDEGRIRQDGGHSVRFRG